VRLYCQEGKEITMNNRRRVFSLLIPAVLAVLIACGVDEDAPSSAPPTSAPNSVPSEDTAVESTPDPAPRSTPLPATSSTELQEAEIHSISVIVLESDPPRYTAQVRVIQPDGCATFGHIQARQQPDETDIFLTAFNEVAVGESVICADAIRTFEQSVPLGIDFEPGVAYTVSGGGATTTFTPQGEPPAYSFDRLFAELDSLVGAVAGERVEQPFSTVPAQLIDVSGGTVQVYEFETIAQAIDMAVGLEQNQQILWTDTPHFFRRGNVFVIYIGNDAGVLDALSTALRSAFTRPFEPDASIDDEPLNPPAMEPTPTPAPPGEFNLGLKVIPDGPDFLFVAELMGGPNNDESLYCQGWTLSPGDGTGIAVMPGCVMYTPDVEIQRHFEMIHTYEEAGVYEAVFEYGQLTSNSVRVVVESVEPRGTADSDPVVPVTPAESPTGTSSSESQPAQMVWPTLLTLDPQTPAPGHQIKVVGQGGYLFTPPSGDRPGMYNESSRHFDLFFDGEVAGIFSCYVNRCDGDLNVPDDAAPGWHAITTEGGAILRAEVKG
jgi:hypothetical protein